MVQFQSEPKGVRTRRANYLSFCPSPSPKTGKDPWLSSKAVRQTELCLTQLVILAWPTTLGRAISLTQSINFNANLILLSWNVLLFLKAPKVQL